MNWRRVLIDGPARLYDLWWQAYAVLLAAGAIICLGGVAIVLILWLFGIRAGW